MSEAGKPGKTAGRAEIWKFGGASLADAGAVRRAASLIAAHRGPLLVVASALAGVTDALLDGAKRSASGDADAGAEVGLALHRRHRLAVESLLPPGPARWRTIAILDGAIQEYRDVCRAVAALGDLSPRASDLLVSRGERLASALLAAAIGAAGRRAAVVDALEVVATDGRHGSAMPDLELTRSRARRVLAPLWAKGTTPVVPGYLGRAPDGSLTTLGRGGSDLTATSLARAIGARRVVLWKDVPGILTADPRAVPDARLIPQLHHREAAEVAYFGAKVLHPRALIPLDGSRVQLQVRSFLTPDRPGTEVSMRRTLERYPVKALASVPGQALVTVAGKGMLGVPGIAARAFTAVHAAGLSVSTIFQASSEMSIGFTLPEAEASHAVAALKRAFRDELASGMIDDVTSRSGVAVIAVVGEGMAGTPGIAARVFTALAKGGVNVIAIAQGSSERNISFVVAAAEAAEAARRVHAAFQLAKIGGGRADGSPRSDVVMLGFGRVGRALADPIAARLGESRVRVVGLLDRSGYVFDPKGLSRKRLLALAQGKDEGALLKDLGGRVATAQQALAHIAGHAVSRPILVDVTAEETGDLLRQALAFGFDLVLANKKPLAGSRESHQALLAAARAAGCRIRYEATVGAGLPILDTYRKLVESGDRVLRIEGCVSGTLGFVLSAVSAGRPFSEAVRDALARGYTEPDPRDDLSGRDAARKALILARLMGYRGGSPAAQDLTPPALARLPLPQFLERLPELDQGWRQRVEREARRGQVLRYVVTATPRSVKAGLQSVPAASPIGSLSGTRNLISFTTRRYRAEPLVVMGPGAGPEVTAAGILNDLEQLAAT
ncbi:MAG TPA: aspartate kinase [Vicinamibacteria bacterium]|nr:aspartate kinase [Vicinamibacteria bacterium]